MQKLSQISFLGHGKILIEILKKTEKKFGKTLNASKDSSFINYGTLGDLTGCIRAIICDKVQIDL